MNQALESETQFLANCSDFLYPEPIPLDRNRFVATALGLDADVEYCEMNLEGKITGTESSMEVFFLTRIYLEFTLETFDMYHPSIRMGLGGV